MIAFRGSASNNGGPDGVTTIAVTVPSATEIGDQIIVAVCVRSNLASTTVTEPSGWTLVRSDDRSTPSVLTAVYRRTAQSGDASTAFTWTLSNSQRCGIVCAVYSGVDEAAPVDTSGAQANAASTTITAPSITTSVTDTMLIGLFSTTTNTTMTTGMTERAEDGSTFATAGSNCRVMLAEEARAASGATGTRTATQGTSRENLGTLLALTSAIGHPMAARRRGSTEPTGAQRIGRGW
jgi:hypothetical protein